MVADLLQKDPPPHLVFAWLKHMFYVEFSSRTVRDGYETECQTCGYNAKLILPAPESYTPKIVSHGAQSSTALPATIPLPLCQKPRKLRS